MIIKNHSDFTKFFSPAKVNLFLKVINKRPDGYHNIQSLFTFIDLNDEIFVEICESKNETQEIKVDNPLSGCREQDDLIYKACQQILPGHLSISIKVKKNIPQGGGLGGGSSNAATTLIAINQLCKLGLSFNELADIGLKIGADVPFFIHNSSAFVEGVGEKITKVNITPLQILLCYPQTNISTKQIFSAFKLTNKSKELKITAPCNYEQLIHTQGNDLEPYVLLHNDKIKQIYSYLNQYGNARITGTGSCCFLILNDDHQNDEIIKNMPSNVDYYFVSTLNHNKAYNRSI